MDLFKLENRLSKKGIFVLFFCMLFFRLFRPLGFTDDVWKVFFYPTLLYLAIVVSTGVFKGNYRDYFSNPLRLVLGSIVLSSIICMMTWGQSIFDTLISSFSFFSFIIYFYLLKENIKIKEMENVMWWFVLIFLICFYAALAVAPFRLFLGYGEIGKELDDARGMSRIRLTLIGGGPLYLAYFLSISKFKTSTRKWKWFTIISVLFLTIVLQLGRQAILFSAVFGLLLYLRGTSFAKKLIALILVISSIYLLPILAGSVFDGLKERTEQELDSQEDGEDNVRIAAYKFYFSDVSRNILNDLFGNGFFSLGKSKYADYVDKYGRSQGLIPADVGYASIYLYYGVFGLTIFGLILIRVLRLKVNDDYYYAKYYIYFLYCGNIAGSTLLGTIPTFCLALYILSKGNLLYNFKKTNKSIRYAEN